MAHPRSQLVICVKEQAMGVAWNGMWTRGRAVWLHKGHDAYGTPGMSAAGSGPGSLLDPSFPGRQQVPRVAGFLPPTDLDGAPRPSWAQ